MRGYSESIKGEISMKILAIAQVENDKNVKAQLKKQTLQPTSQFIFVDPEPAKGINSRRRRIVENHKHLVEIVETTRPDYVFQIEGDGDLPENALEKLLEDIQKLPKKTAYVSGIEVGRHGLYILGAWHFRDDFKEFRSLDYKLKGIQEVDATGFYCLLAPRKAWLKGICDWDMDPWGPDVNWGLSLKAQGYKIYCDMDIKVGHITERGTIRVDNISTENATFTEKDGMWSYKTH